METQSNEMTIDIDVEMTACIAANVRLHSIQTDISVLTERVLTTTEMSNVISSW